MTEPTVYRDLANELEVLRAQRADEFASMVEREIVDAIEYTLSQKPEFTLTRESWADLKNYMSHFVREQEDAKTKNMTEDPICGLCGERHVPYEAEEVL